MILSITNLSVLLLIILYLKDTLLINIFNNIYVSIICIIVILGFCLIPYFVQILEKIKSKLHRNRKKDKANKIIEKEQSDTTGNTIERDSLKDFLQILLTVFNTVYFVLNGIYLFLILNIFENNTLEALSLDPNSLGIPFVVLFWFLIVAIVLSAKDWNYNDKVLSLPKKHPKNAEYYSQKINSRK